MRGRAIRMQANKKFSREMLAAMDEKRERLAREQEEDRLYVLKCKKVCSKKTLHSLTCCNAPETAEK